MNDASSSQSGPFTAKRLRVLTALVLTATVFMVPWAFSLWFQLFGVNGGKARTGTNLFIGIGLTWLLLATGGCVALATRSSRKPPETAARQPSAARWAITALAALVLIGTAVGGVHRTFPEKRIVATLEAQARALPGVTAVQLQPEDIIAYDYKQRVEATSSASLAELCSRSEGGISESYGAAVVGRAPADSDGPWLSCGWSESVGDVFINYFVSDINGVRRIDLSGSLS